MSECQMSSVAYKRIKKSYHAVFRHIILHLMPASELGKYFHSTIGRPTKELYSVAGLILLKEFHSWTCSDAVDAYLFDKRVQYALNLGHHNISFSEKTLERYQKLIREDNLAGQIFEEITMHLIKELDLKVDKQRLDSTHVFSDMARFGRTKLMATAITNFLTQLKRHHRQDHTDLGEEILARYAKKIDKLFAEYKKDAAKKTRLQQNVVDDMYLLIQLFENRDDVNNKNTYKTLVKVFNQQCELKVIPQKRDKNDSETSGSL